MFLQYFLLLLQLDTNIENYSLALLKYCLTKFLKIMKKLELNQMENLEGGIDNKDAAACGFGVGIATFGWGLLGPFALIGLTLCMHGDS